MIALSHLNLRRRVADKIAIDLDVRTRRSRADLQPGGYRTTVLIMAAGTRIGLGSGCCRLKLRNIELHVSIDISGELGSLRKGNVLAVHEQEEWCSRKEQNARPHDSGCHIPGVAAAFASFHRAQGRLLAAQ